MKIVPELLVCLLLLIFNSMQKNKSIILSGVLKILCQFLGITKMKPDELSLVVCPSSWIPAFLQPTKRILKRKIFKFCLVFFHFTHDLKPVGFESAVFFTWSCFLTGGCSDLVACLLEVLYLIKAAGYWYKPETETPFSPFTWLESPAWQCQCPQRDGTWSKVAHLAWKWRWLCLIWITAQLLMCRNGGGGSQQHFVSSVLTGLVFLWSFIGW